MVPGGSGGGGASSSAGPAGYTSLRDAFSAFQAGAATYANIYAVVAESTMPTKSKGTDQFVNLYVCDESTEGWSDRETVELMIFAREVYQLPGVRKIGDVIRLNKVKLQAYGRGASMKPQLCGKIAGPKNAATDFRFCLFPLDAPQGQPDTPYLAPFVNEYSMTRADAERIAQLRAFSAQRAARSASAAMAANLNVYLRPVSSLVSSVADHEQPELVDLICKVLAVDRREPDVTVVHLWDGSDLPPVPSTFSVTPPIVMSTLAAPLLRPRPLPLVAIGERPPRTHAPSSGDVSVCDSLPEMGSAVPLLLPRQLGRQADEHGRWDSELLGCWVKIKVLCPFAVGGQVQLLYVDRSRVISRPVAAEAEAKYERRLARTSMWAPSGPAGFSSRCGCPEDMRPVSVRNLLSHVHMGAPGLFRLNARVAGYFPPLPWSRSEHPLIPLTQLGLPASETSAAATACGHTYALKLLLEDASGQCLSPRSSSGALVCR